MYNIMKIGMAGSHGTGKTTMANAMVAHEQFSNLGLVPSTARQIKAYGYPINREASEISQLLVPVLRILDEYDAAFRPDAGIISDRTPVDSLAYTMYQNMHVWDNGDLIEHVAYRLAKMHMDEYDYVLYFPVYWNNVVDDVRDPDEEYRKEIDRLVLSSLEMLDVNFMTVPNITPEKRVEWFLSQVQKDFGK